MMDFGGALDLSGLVGPENRAASHPVSDQDPTTKPKTNGSGFLKKGRSGSGEEDWRISQTARTDDDSAALLLRSNQPNMISFSSPKSEVPFLSKSGGGFTESSSQNSGFTYSTRNTGYGSRGLNGGMNAPLVGARGPFTPSQWVELEHQALIYKYILANVPVPSNLLTPLKNFFTQYGLSGLSSGSYAPNSLGWGSFHLGFTGNTDPEPGRCRRTDGKKWRCSKDAVPDQKYCERHLNRNRHRSRKPVEGQNGQAVSGSAKKVEPISCSSSASVMPSGGASNSFDITQHQFKCLQPGAEKPSADVLVNRMQDPEGLSMVSPTTNRKSKDYPFSIPKQHIPIEESSGFGLVSSDSLMNPSRKSSYVNSTTYNSILDFNNPKSSDTQHSLRHFVDDWPEDQSNHATIAWPEELKSDWTQLSMSIPMASSDFSSTSSSSPQEKIAHSPLSLSHEFDPIQMGLTVVNNNLNQLTEKQTNWIPISWGSSVGGPLGEVLNSSSSTLEGWKKSALNLTTGIWNGSPQLHGSSPTGVLNKATFVSLSNSSSGNSTPRADENLKTNGTGSLGGDTIGSTVTGLRN